MQDNKNSFIHNENTMYIIFAVLLHFITINANYISNTVGCEYIKFFKNNIMVKHLIGFIVMFVFVILNINSNSKYVIISITTISYIIFIITSRTHFPHGLIIYGMFAFVYLLHIYKLNIINKIHDKNKRDLKEKIIKQENIIEILNYIDYDSNQLIVNQNTLKIEKIQFYIIIITIICLIIFFSMYILEKYNKYKNNTDFSIVKLLFGNNIC